MDTNEKQIVHVEQKNYEMPPRTGITVTHFLIVADIDRSARWYAKIFDGRILKSGDSNGAPAVIQFANTWLLVNVGGGPTPDKPTITLNVHNHDGFSSFMNVRVADIQACYELWKSRGPSSSRRRSPKPARPVVICVIRMVILSRLGRVTILPMISCLAFPKGKL